MQSRAFNSVSIDSNKSICIKTSSNIEKLGNEIEYYLKLPKQLSNFFPKMLAFNMDYSTYQLEYIPFSSLQKLFINQELSYRELEFILNELMQVLYEMHSLKAPIAIHSEEIADFYINKTHNRIQALDKIPFFKELLSLPVLKINGKKYDNFCKLEDKFCQLIKNYSYIQFKSCVIHGDFCFSNILYSSTEKKIKLIDPRGSFIDKGIHGHDLYDYAKLLHCLHGHYDYIANDLFYLQQNGIGEYYFEIPTSNLIQTFKKQYLQFLSDNQFHLEFIYLIESSLFLSMASLHYENLERQIILYLIGILFLNQVMEGKYENMH